MLTILSIRDHVLAVLYFRLCVLLYLSLYAYNVELQTILYFRFCFSICRLTIWNSRFCVLLLLNLQADNFELQKSRACNFVVNILYSSTSQFVHLILALITHHIPKPFGKTRKAHIFGLEGREEQSQSSTTTEQVSEQLRAEIEANKQLREQVKALQERVHQLEQATPNTQQLVIQIKCLATPTTPVYHGPDSVEHFTEFSIDTVLNEFEQIAPDVFRLLKTLGNLDQQVQEGEEVSSIQGSKVVMAMYALLKSRTIKVLGLQLLISFMLVARSTSRQVCVSKCTYM